MITVTKLYVPVVWRKKKLWVRFLPALLTRLASSLVQPVISSVVKGISGTEIRREGKGYMDKNV